MTQLQITTDKIIDLVKRPGYIYAFIITIVRDCFYDLNNPEEFESRNKLITEELMTLLGFWVQHSESHWSYPISFEDMYQMVLDADMLMKEMHNSSYETVFQETSQIIQSCNSNGKHELSDEAKAQSIQEAIYYNGDSAYDYEYVHFLKKKYKYDREWLIENKGFNIDNAGEIALEIKRLINSKASKLSFPNRSINYKTLGIDSIEEFNKLLTFAPFINILSPFENDGMSCSFDDAIVPFCNQIRDLFCVSCNDLVGLKDAGTFLNLFSFSITPNCNQTYQRFGDYNILQATPIIRLEEDRYFVPLIYQLFVSLYESPYYWIMADKQYFKKAGSNRGKAAEEIVYELLTPIFGEQSVFRDLEIKDSKHHTITDIDTLCMLGTKAICFQVKSKRLSQISRTGTINDLTRDFKCAVQDAYEQGLLCRKHILNPQDALFWSKETKEIVKISDNIDEVFIVCLTSENYPALTHQVHELLIKQKEDPYPVVFSAFDLGLIAHYLDNPYKFTYYIRQRVATSSYYYSTNEINYLAYHLIHKLFPQRDYSREYLANDFACEIDKDYYPFISGLQQEHEPGSIKRKWECPEFEALCCQIAHIQHPKVTDIIFLLYDLSSEAREKLIEHLNYVKERSLQNGTIVNIRAQCDLPESIVGITCISEKTIEGLYKDMYYLEHLHKYHYKANQWLTLAVLNTSSNLVDLAIYDDSKWTYDATLERLCAENVRGHIME